MCAPAAISRAALAQGLLRAFLVAAKRHVADDQRVARAARHAADVIGHFFQADRQG